MRSAVAIVAGSSVLLSLWLARFCVTTDTFLCLVVGREIAAHGLPSANTLTVMQYGAPWFDQQWLSHVVLFRVHELGGFGGLLMLRVLTTAGACALALGCAARRGASTPAILLGGALGLALILFKAKVRGQMFAEPLFVGVVLLLLSQQRALSWRASGAVVALMLVWSNVHGSVLLGAALIVVFAVTRLVARIATRKDAVLVALSGLSILATPNGSGVWSYYRATLGNPLFRKYISEWGGADWQQSSFLIVISIATVGLLLLARNSASWFERLCVALLMAFSLYSVRQALFFGFLLLLLGPALIDAALPARVRAFGGGRGLRALAVVVVLPAVLFLALAVKVFDTVIAEEWPQRTAAVVGELAGRDGKVFAAVSHADRLLWRRPELAGRIAFDARFELISADQLSAIADVLRDPNHPQLRPFSVFVVDAAAKGLLEPHGFELIERDAQAAVYRRLR